MSFKPYKRGGVTEMMPWDINCNLANVSISDADFKAGSPKQGDWIARNPKNHDDMWLVSAEYFEQAGFEPAY